MWTEFGGGPALLCRKCGSSLPCRLSLELPPLEATSFLLLLFDCEEATGKLNLQHLCLHCHNYTKAPFEREKSGGLILFFQRWCPIYRQRSNWFIIFVVWAGKKKKTAHLASCGNINVNVESCKNWGLLFVVLPELKQLKRALLFWKWSVSCNYG